MVKLLIIILLIILLKYYFTIYIPNIFFENNKKKIIKKVLLSKIFKLTNRSINNISNIFINNKTHFGNYFISINNAIIYCEFLGCKKLIIEYNNNIYINSPIFYKENNITIETNKAFNSMDNNSITLGARFFYHNGFRWFKNINKLRIYRKYILYNLPKVATLPDDLYIYKVIHGVIPSK